MFGFLRASSIVVAGGALAAGYALAGRPVAAAVAAVPGILWLVFLQRRRALASDVGLVACSVAAAAGMMLDVGPAWMLLALLAALTAWDLEAFGRWLHDCPSPDDARALGRRHLQRLLAVDLLGLGLGLLSLQLRLRLRLGVLIVLGLVLAVGLSRVVRSLRRQVE